MRVVIDDGGRKAAGFKGEAEDCVCRAIAIAAKRPYREIYDLINNAALSEKTRRGFLGTMYATGRKSSARTGVWKDTERAMMRDLGWEWTPTMGIGTGCKVHLRDGELPMGRLVVAVSKHLVAVIDGVIHDTHDTSRGGTRCVYGYYSKT